MKSQIRPAIVCFILMTVLTGAIYPAVITLLAQTVFSDKANGSIIMRDDHAIGSTLIAQPFTEAKYFWPRPSAAKYDGTAGAGSNLGPTNPARAQPTTQPEVPVDLLTASASGLDPHISPEAAMYQVHHVAVARNMTDEAVQNVVDQIAQPRTFGLLGEPRVNVLKLNLALDHPELLTPSTRPTLAPLQTYRWRGFLPD